ncbi:MAG TPA: amino acid ABC transporter ATP-binding protein [Micromonosporaceae bacterium]
MTLRSIVKRIGGTEILRGVDLDVEPGTVVSIIGPSGAGKSTLLRCVNLLETPTSGTIHVEGRLVFSGTAAMSRGALTALRRRVGMVFQSFNLFPHLTVLRNVSLAQMRVLGRTRSEADERSMDLLRRVGMEHKHASYPAQCSGGEQQRVAIARALSLDPSVMLFDEPTSALDAELGLEVLNVMRQLAADGMTMIVVTHALHFAGDVSDRIVVMDHGRIIESGDPQAVLTEPSQERTRRFLRAVLEG